MSAPHAQLYNRLFTAVTYSPFQRTGTYTAAVHAISFPRNAGRELMRFYGNTLNRCCSIRLLQFPTDHLYRAETYRSTSTAIIAPAHRAVNTTWKLSGDVVVGTAKPLRIRRFAVRCPVLLTLLMPRNLRGCRAGVILSKRSLTERLRQPETRL